MIDAQGDVLYVGKAKNIKKRVTAYARPTGHDSRIARMIAATATMEFVTTKTETEALLLEANLIKRLRPRFNVLLRDDKSFPYILITSDHWAPQILKHRGARTRPGHYYGPFASLARSTAPSTRCSARFCCAPARMRFSRPHAAVPAASDQALLGAVHAARSISPTMASWCARRTRSSPAAARSVQDELAGEMEKASTALDFERAAIYRDRLAALSAIQSHQGINPRSVEEADVFAVHQDGGYTCVEVFFFRTGQNWGNRAYFPKADRALGAGEVLSAFLAQFYDDKPPPRLHSRLARLRGARAAGRGAEHQDRPQGRGRACRSAASARNWSQHALANAREALARKLADTSSQQKLLKALTETFGAAARAAPHRGLRQQPHQGTNAVGAMIVAGPEGFRKNQYRKFNIRSADLTPGDDFGMMREVLQRRFKRLLAEAPRLTIDDGAGRRCLHAGEARRSDEQPWPDLVLIDGGQGQLNAARETLAALGVTDVPLVAIAKGPDRDAGRETFFMAGREPVQAAAARSRCSISSSGCATRRTASPSARTARGARRTSARPACRKFPGIGPDPQARAAASFRHGESDRARLACPTSRRCRELMRRPRERYMTSSTRQAGMAAEGVASEIDDHRTTKKTSHRRCSTPTRTSTIRACARSSRRWSSTCTPSRARCI